MIEAFIERVVHDVGSSMFAALAFSSAAASLARSSGSSSQLRCSFFV